MRQVFSSPRLENVERVAQLLRDAGIEARITHNRSYKGTIRGDFSYRDHTRTEPVPAVWVVRSQDQPAARALLRASGLLDSTRGETGYTLPAFRTEAPAAADAPGRKRAFRLKVGLLLVITIVLVLAFLPLRKPPQTLPQRAGAGAPVLPAGVSPTPDALAVAVLAGELPTRAGQAICVSVDGRDPSSTLLAALPPAPGRVVPASQCRPQARLPLLALGDYRAARTRAGSIVLERRRGSTLLASQRYQVRQDAAGWRVIELIP